MHNFEEAVFINLIKIEFYSLMFCKQALTSSLAVLFNISVKKGQNMIECRIIRIISLDLPRIQADKFNIII